MCRADEIQQNDTVFITVFSIFMDKISFQFYCMGVCEGKEYHFEMNAA